MTPTADTQFDPAHPPPPLLTSEIDSFANKTMSTRKPAALKTVLDDAVGRYPTHRLEKIQGLLDELAENQPLRPLEDSPAPDLEDWQQAWQAHRGRRWLDIPWYFAESFLYRRLMDAVGYFADEPWGGLDPFLPRKQAELAGQTPWRTLASALAQSTDNSPDSLRTLLQYGVWGNRIDLSYTQVAQSSGGQITVETERANLLVDDTAAVLQSMQRGGGAEAQGRIFLSPPLPSTPTPLLNIHFICDNAGTELLTDLALVDFLLRCRWAGQVTLHLKAHPTFVSDTILADIELTLRAMREQGNDDFTALADRLDRYRRQQRLRLRADFFWNSSHFFWEFLPTLQTELAQAHLVIIKGDANYRRLLGDSRWPTTASIADAVPYFPAPFVTLRTLKSDPIVGLSPGQADHLDQEDAEWRVNGKRGLIQAVL